MTNALLGVEEGGLKGPKNQLEGKEFPHHLSEILLAWKEVRYLG